MMTSRSVSHRSYPVFASALALVLAACTATAGTSPSAQPVASASAPPGAAPAPSASAEADVSGLMRDHLLERTLPDVWDGRPLVKWSINSGVLRQVGEALAPRDPGADEAVVAAWPLGGVAYAAAWYQTSWGAMGQRLIQAIRVAGAEPDELLADYQRASPTESKCVVSTAVPGRDALECPHIGWVLSTTYLYASGDTLYILDDPFVAAALPE